MKRLHGLTTTKHLLPAIALVLAMTTGRIRAEPPILEKKLESAARQAVGRALSYHTSLHSHLCSNRTSFRAIRESSRSVF